MNTRDGSVAIVEKNTADGQKGDFALGTLASAGFVGPKQWSLNRETLAIYATAGSLNI